MGENDSVSVNDANFTTTVDDAFASAADVTPWIVGTYYCVLVLGVLINLCLVISLLQQKKHGTTYLILQLATIDILAAWVGAAEVSALHSQDWRLHPDLCPLFLGTEVLSNGLAVYLHVLLNFHAISAWNMQTRTGVRDKNPLTSDVAESSNECLVWPDTPPPANRTLNIDYRPRRTSVSVLVPSLLIWFGCVSLSIPEYTLSTTVPCPTNRTTLCTIVDLHYTHLFQGLLIACRGFIPMPLLLVTLAVATFKLCNGRSLSDVQKNSSAKKFHELRTLLLLSIGLSVLYTVASLQRSVVHLLHIVREQSGQPPWANFEMPPLASHIVTHHTGMSLSMIHYACLALRPVLCIVTMPGTMAPFRNCLAGAKDNRAAGIK